MKALFVMLLLIFASAVGSSGVMAESLSLTGAVERALASAPGFLAEQARRDGAREDVILARAWLMPYIKGSGSYTRFRQSYNYDRPLAFPLPDQLNFSDSKISVDLIQPLFHLDWWAGWKQGRLADEAAGVALDMARDGLILEVASRYADVVVARETLKSVRAKHKALQSLAEMSRARLAAGLSTITEKLEADSHVRLADAELLDAEKSLNLARERLASMLGGEVSPASLPESLPDIVVPPAREWEDLARQQAPSVRLAELKRRISGREVQKSVGSALPSVDLVAGYVREKTTNGIFGAGSVRKDQRIGIQVDVPIYAGGGTWAQLRKAKKQRLEAEYRLQDARRQAALTAREAALNLETARARVVALRQAVRSAREARNAARTSYEAGLSTMVDVFNAESRLAEARGNLAAARRGVLMARLQLAASIGNLKPDRLPVLASRNRMIHHRR